MGRAMRLGGGTGETGLAIEYVRSRKVVRLLGWLCDEPITPVEVPVDQLCPGLGISPRDIGAAMHYLLFAGSHRRPAGGLRDLVATFDDDDLAWTAFRELRQAHPATQGWAELATIDALGHVDQLAWFGLHPAAEPRTEPAPAVPGAVRRDRARRLASDTRAGYLHAVTPS